MTSHQNSAPNRLAHTNSPYLLDHAHNPVDWYPWGEEAFAAAREQGKPIFLSVGYSTCYWCHVMAREDFEDNAIAALMNKHFVNIKVDREQRPDVDEVYMTATQVMTGRGGWPNSLFLTPPGSGSADDPGLKPFWAGTYLPPRPVQGMPSFPQILEAVAAAWRERRKELINQAEKVADAIRRVIEHGHRPGPVEPSCLSVAADKIMTRYDPRHGGFGGAPKFPQPIYLKLLWAAETARGQTGDSSSYAAAARHTLIAMAQGGIHDQIGGGFHRYSTDAKWLVPHFEKMLYDNAQLLEAYALGYEHGRGDEPFARLSRHVMRGIVGYLEREMADASGGFYSAQDAEVDAHEGENFLWTPARIDKAIRDADLAALAKRLYGLDEGPNFRDPHDPDAEPTNVLYLPHSMDELAADMGVTVTELEEKRDAIDAALLAARQGRPQPATDDKILVAWNGMMIAALAHAGQALDEPHYLDMAAQAAELIITRMTDSAGGLYRSMRQGETQIPGFLEDYAFFVQGLLALHQATGKPYYLDLAGDYTRIAIGRFAADSGGGYFDVAADQSELFVRVRSSSDGATPSATGRMVLNLVELYQITGEKVYLDRAVDDLRSFAHVMAQQPEAVAQLALAASRIASVADQALTASDDGVPASKAESSPAAPVQVTAEPAALHWHNHATRATIHVHIAEGYHINAHEIEDDTLIPTTLSLIGGSDIALFVEYPPATPRRFVFSDQPLPIYEGHVVLHATLRAGTAPPPREITLVLRCQPCTDDRCLAPQNIRITLKSRFV